MTAETVGSEGGAPPSAYEWQWGWALAVAVNLPIPLLFGLAAVAKGGLFGMCAGIGAFWLAGAVVIARVPSVRALVVYGPLFFAFSQFFPVVQVMAGAAAVDLFDRTHDPMSEPTAFLVTVATGGLLLFAALVCRLFVYLCGCFWNRLVGRRPQDRCPV